MSSSNGLPSAATIEEKPTQITRAMAWLKAEQNAADTPSYTSLLLHESAVILESCQEDDEAARQYRAALTFDGTFREPLERLIALAEHHHQLDDLGSLYRQLATSADNTDERARAQVELAFHLVAQGDDPQQAAQILRDVVAESPGNAVAWLLLDLVADRGGDLATRESALEAQLNLTDHAQYRSLLLLEWAALREQLGDVERALELVDLAVAEASSATYLALLRREQIALRANRSSEYLRTLEQRIRLIERAIADARSAEALGVLQHHRNETALGSFQVLAAQAHANSGDLARADSCLAVAQDLLPNDHVPAFVTWVNAERAEDWPRFLSIGTSLAQRATQGAAAWLWLRLALVHWRLGDHSSARQCVNHGLLADPRSLALRALDVHLALQKRDGMQLASALEAATDCFHSEAEKAQWLLAAAGVWALLVRDASGAKAAVAQAGMHGLDSTLAQQASRLLARWSGDLRYYDDSTRIAQQQATTPLERIDLLLELLRVRLLRQDYSRALDAVAQIAAGDETPILSGLVEATLGNCLRRMLDDQASPPSGPPRPPAPTEGTKSPFDWAKLAPHVASEDMRRALQLGSAVTALVANRLEYAKQQLAELAERDPSDIVVAVARVALAFAEGNGRSAPAILRRTAECTPDADLRAALALQGALLGILQNHIEDVPQALDLAGLTHPQATAAVARWILRRVSDQDPALAQRVCGASADHGSPQRRQLEELGLSIAQGNWQGALTSPDREPVAPQTALELATTLARSIANGALAEGDPVPPTLAAAQAAITYFERDSATSNGPARDVSETTLDEPVGTPISQRRLSDARNWAGVDPSLVAQLEWFLACRNANEAFEEADARDRIASHLGEREAEALRVSAHLQRFLSGATNVEMLPSTSASARLANLETALPGCDPRRRATAIEEAGELLGTASTIPLRGALGYNQLAAGDNESARITFSGLVETHPRFIPAWLGLRLIAERTSNRALLAQACAALGDLLSEPQHAAVEWERAANILLDELSDNVRGRMALERAISLDINRDKAFTRLFRMVRESQQSEQLLELISRRLPHASTEEEQLMLHWERARSKRALGDREGALASLDAVSAIDPNHVGALALAGEIHIALGQYDDAARFLSQLARQSEAPVKQRLMGGLAAADLFDKKMNRPTFAKDILLALHREGHSTEALRERLSGLAIRTHAFPLAVELLEILMSERDSSDGRADAARLALVLCRDQLQTPERATAAVERLLSELPGDEEALDLILTGCFEHDITERWLRPAESLIRRTLVQQPLDVPRLERLARIAQWFNDARTRQVCLGALIATGAGTQEMDVELSDLDARVAHVPAMTIDEQSLAEICDPNDHGPMAALFQDFAGVFADALGPTLAVLGVGRKQRVEPRAGLPLRNEIVAWAGAFGIAEFDLYLTDRVAGDAIAVPTERPSLVVSTNLTVPLDARGRQAIARELLGLRRGTCLLRHRSTTDLAALIVAACQVGGNPLVAPAYAMLEEFVRALSSALPRRLRKLLAERTLAIRQHCETDAAIQEFLDAATASQDRAAALAAGDVSHVLAHLTGQRGRAPSTQELRARASRLFSFALSSRYLDLKDRLGLSVR